MLMYDMHLWVSMYLLKLYNVNYAWIKYGREYVHDSTVMNLLSGDLADLAELPPV